MQGPPSAVGTVVGGGWGSVWCGGGRLGSRCVGSVGCGGLGRVHNIFRGRAQPYPLTEPVVAHILFLAQELGVPNNDPILTHDSFPFPIVHLDFPVGMGVPDTVVLQPYNEWRDRTKVPYAAGEGRG